MAYEQKVQQVRLVKHFESFVVQALDDNHVPKL